MKFWFRPSRSGTKSARTPAREANLTKLQIRVANFLLSWVPGYRVPATHHEIFHAHRAAAYSSRVYISAWLPRSYDPAIPAHCANRHRAITDQWHTYGAAYV